MSSVQSSAFENLKKLGIDVAEFEALLVPDDKESTALLVGSINEGFGNAKSDVDVLVVYPSDRFIVGWSESREGTVVDVDPATFYGGMSLRQKDALIVFIQLKTGHRVQLTITREDHVRHLQDQVVAYIESARQRIEGQKKVGRRKGVSLFYAEHKFLHRLYTGHILFNTPGTQAIRSHVGFDVFSDYLVLAKANELLGLIEDLLGVFDEYEEGEDETKLLVLQQVFLKLISVLLVASGELNVGEKFFFRLLDRHQARIGEDLAKRLNAAYKSLYPSYVVNFTAALVLIDETLKRASELSPILAADIKSRGQKPVSDFKNWGRGEAISTKRDSTPA